MAAETIAVLSLKGGTGKTTTVRTLADVLRRVGLSVLTIDLDPQGNLSDYFDVPPDASPTIADVLSGEAKASEAVHDGIIPATPILAEVERSMSGKMGRELVLRKALKGPRQSYDVILIDCAPSLGILTINALAAADKVLIPAQTEFLASKGISLLIDTINTVRVGLNPDLEIAGVLPTMYKTRQTHDEAVLSAMELGMRHHGIRLFEPIARAALFNKASIEGRPATQVAPKSPAIENYVKLAHAIA